MMIVAAAVRAPRLPFRFDRTARNGLWSCSIAIRDRIIGRDEFFALPQTYPETATVTRQ